MRYILFIIVVTLCVSYGNMLAQEKSMSEVDKIVSEISTVPDWSVEREKLTSKYDKHQIDSLMQLVKVRYFFRQQDYPNYVKSYITRIITYNIGKTSRLKNAAAWEIFSYASDSADLKIASQLIREAIAAEPFNYFHLDTYANILYKSGDLAEAKRIEAVAVTSGGWTVPVILNNLYKMEKGLPTWVYPAIEKQAETLDQQLWTALRTKTTRQIDSAFWIEQVKHTQLGADKTEYILTLMRFVDEFRPARNAFVLNMHAWDVCQYSDNKANLKTALAWSDESLKNENMVTGYDFIHAYLDTKANLLYKLGKRKKAIEVEEAAIARCPEAEKASFEATLEKMKRGDRLGE